MVRVFVVFALSVLILLVGLLLGSTLLISSDIQYESLVDKNRNAESFFYSLPSGALAHIRDEGNRDGPPMLLVHGANGSLHHWQAWVKELGHRYRLISFDLPGHGLTGAVPDADYSRMAMARFVLEIVDLLELKKTILVGHSMGGEVVLQFALNNPLRVRALVLLASSGLSRDGDDSIIAALRFTNSPFLLSMMRYVTPRFIIRSTLRSLVDKPDKVITPAMVERHWELLRMTGSREATIKRYTDRKNETSLDAKLGRIKHSTLLLWGVNDPLIPLKYGVRMNAGIFDSRIIGYRDIGHFPMLEAPVRSAADVDAYLSTTLKLE